MGLVLALAVAVGLLFWQLGVSQERVASMREDNDRLTVSLDDALGSYELMVAEKDHSIELLITRGHEREGRIAMLTEQNWRLAAIPDDHCLDRVMPDDVIRLLEGPPRAGAGTDPHLSTRNLADDLPKPGTTR